MKSKTVVNEKKGLLEKRDYVAFDCETSGMSDVDQFIRISAIKVRGGEIIDHFDELIKPDRILPTIIEEVTKITNGMLEGKPSEKEVVANFLKWINKDTLVTHNAQFEIKYFNSAIKKYNLSNLNNTVIDILTISRKLDKQVHHNIVALAEKYNIEFNGNDGTEIATHKLYNKYVDILNNQGIYYIDQLNKLVEE